ncbi:DUF4339 domain-containing protein [Bradyrhizobium zhanjiangense]|uniref:DUF4339 domain-containing protein n=1 Tax=Bradyrhizobium zhanjiangense TaxID=1325107 RepID=A0A4Q0Q7D2_9BRAD|nr:DUF4339 domain-containing protein [Bradyrhizobium zhanjiangense]RXG84844.1 DUF4339 domain-containing protein [Bradyrhizobium zhanjiangense]
MTRQSCIAGWSTIGHIVSRDYIPYLRESGPKRGRLPKTVFIKRKAIVTEELSAPPPLPDPGVANQPAPNEWYYVVNGARRGPMTADTMKDLLNSNQIAADTQVWRKGMPEWKPLRESNLGDLVPAEAPAISSKHIGNGYVWTLALLPLVIGVIEAVVSASNQEAAVRSLALGFPYHPSRGLPYQVIFPRKSGRV